MIQNETILLVSTLGLLDLPTRKQRIAIALSKDNRLVYLEPPSTYLARFLRKGLPKGKQVKEEGNLTIIRLPDILPFGLTFAWIQKLNEGILYRYLSRIFRILDFTPSILWTYLVDYPGLFKKLKPKIQVYDCVDDHSSYAGLRSPRFVNELEQRVAKDCQVCFATTQELTQKIYDIQPNTFLVTNGVEVNFFLDHPKNKPTEMEPIPAPVIGYFGAIQEWFDAELILKTAQKRKDLSFVLVGPIQDEIRSKLSLPNVYCLGRKSYEEAPSYINSFTVCLIPFIQNQLTLNISPLKFYEYCSLGKPTVSIPVKQMLPVSDLCYLYSTPDEFEKGIDQALTEDKQRKEKRIELAKANDWEAKFRFMFEQVSKAGSLDQD